MAEKKADVWMPIWIGAYLADTMKLTTLQHGAYFLLLIAYWRERKPLADNDDELRSITKMDRTDWKRARPVLSGFFKVGDGVWWHKRVEAEIAAADDRSKKASAKAGKAAQARWTHASGDAQSNAPSIPEALHEDMHEECPPPSPKEQEKKPAASSAKTPTIPCPYDLIIASYRARLPSLPGVKLMDEGRKKALRGFWAWVLSSKKTDGTPRAASADEALAWVDAYFVRASENDWLMGRSERAGKHANWRADIDFLLTERGKRHVIERTTDGEAAA
jgi:uncharacterized protein YdaU (DUF1376 family)